MGRGGRNGCQKVAAGFGCVGLIVLIAVLIGVSVKTLDTNEVGIDLDNFSQSLSTQLYASGTYFTGLAHQFIAYPSAQQTVRYSSPASTTVPGTTQAGVVDPGANGPAVVVRSQDGLPIYVSFAVNFRFVQTFDSLQALYLNYGDVTAATTLVQRISLNVVRSVASNYAALSFAADRGTIRLDMRAAVTAALLRVGVTVDDLLLLDVGVPVDFNAARVAQQSATQQAVQALNNLAVQQINANAQVVVAAQTAQLIVTQATVTAQQLGFTNTAQIVALLAQYGADRTAYSALRSALNMTSPELLSYIWLDAQATAASKGTTAPLFNLPRPSQAQL